MKKENLDKKLVVRSGKERVLIPEEVIQKDLKIVEKVFQKEK